MISNLLKYTERYVTLTEDEVLELNNLVTIKSLKKGDVFFRNGEIANQMYFMLNGCVRLFYNAKGDEKTAYFYTEPQFICAGESYTYQVPASENYQAIEDTDIVIFSRDSIENLIKHSQNFEIIARVATENELINSQKIIESFVTKSAEERYVELLETNGELFQRVPQQYIASFLGVSPETISRIKRRIAEK